MFVRITAKAAPDKQIPAARAIRERVKAAFDRAGVRVPVLMRGMPPGPGGPGSSGGSVTGGSQGASVLSLIVPDGLSMLQPALRQRLQVTQQCRPEDLEAVRERYRSHDIPAELATYFEDMAARLAALVAAQPKPAGASCAPSRPRGVPARRIRSSMRLKKDMNQISLPSHDQMDPQTTWNATSVFASPAAWEAEWTAVVESLPAMRHFQGRLAGGPATLANAMDAMQNLMRRAGRLLVYANMSQAVDTTDQVAAERLSRARSLYGQVAAAISFVDPEVLAIGQETLAQWLREEPRLAYLQHYVDDLFRKQAHVRSAEVEEVLGSALQLGYALPQLVTLARERGGRGRERAPSR